MLEEFILPRMLQLPKSEHKALTCPGPGLHLEMCVILGTLSPFIQSEEVESTLGQFLGV